MYKPKRKRVIYGSGRIARDRRDVERIIDIAETFLKSEGMSSMLVVGKILETALGIRRRNPVRKRGR